MAKCEVCGKRPQFGHNVSFSKRRTNRQFKPNVVKRTLVVNGQTKRLNVCMQCLKTFHKVS
jgi:large subunit ribosomal protein L28